MSYKLAKNGQKMQVNILIWIKNISKCKINGRCHELLKRKLPASSHCLSIKIFNLDIVSGKCPSDYREVSVYCWRLAYQATMLEHFNFFLVLLHYLFNCTIVIVHFASKIRINHALSFTWQFASISDILYLFSIVLTI